MNEEISKLIEEFESRLQALKEEYKECEFKIGDFCWCISESGDLIGSSWRGDEYNKVCYGTGNVFRTREEAEFEVEKRKVLHELKQLGRTYDHDDTVQNWLIALEKDWCMLNVIQSGEYNAAYGDYYFDTKEEAETAISKIGSDRIMKYLFRVED